MKLSWTAKNKDIRRAELIRRKRKKKINHTKVIAKVFTKKNVGVSIMNHYRVFLLHAQVKIILQYYFFNDTRVPYH